MTILTCSTFHYCDHSQYMRIQTFKQLACNLVFRCCQISKLKNKSQRPTKWKTKYDFELNYAGSFGRRMYLVLNLFEF